MRGKKGGKNKLRLRKKLQRENKRESKSKRKRWKKISTNLSELVDNPDFVQGVRLCLFYPQCCTWMMKLV